MVLITLFYFIADNRTQANILEQAGIKNVAVSYKFVKKNIKDFRKRFEGVILNTGSGARKFEAEEYYQFVKENKDNYNLALQYDEPAEIRRTMSYYHMAIEKGLNWVVPILHEDYEVALNFIKPILQTNVLALGKGRDITEEDKGFTSLDKQYQYHGLGKARWLKQEKPPQSVDSPTWLNPVRNGKLQLRTNDGYEEVNVNDHNAILDSMDLCKDYVKKVGLNWLEIKFNKHEGFLKASLALHYLPLFDELKIYDKNVRA